jgi:hypothetical protein
MNFRFRDRSGAFQEIEVAAFVSLLDVLHEELAVTAGINSLFRAPSRAAPAQFLCAHAHVQLAGRDVEFDDIAFLQQRERPTDKGLGGDVQNAGAVASAAHTRVGNTDHVADASF